MARQYAALTPYVEAMLAGKKVTVRFTRFGARAMDYMNVVASLKYVQDAVADRFGYDDDCPLFNFIYEPHAHSKRYGVRIEVSL